MLCFHMDFLQKLAIFAVCSFLIKNKVIKTNYVLFTFMTIEHLCQRLIYLLLFYYYNCYYYTVWDKNLISSIDQRISTVLGKLNSLHTSLRWQISNCTAHYLVIKTLTQHNTYTLLVLFHDVWTQLGLNFCFSQNFKHRSPIKTIHEENFLTQAIKWFP